MKERIQIIDPDSLKKRGKNGKRHYVILYVGERRKADEYYVQKFR